jgi:hypothetical protein
LLRSGQRLVERCGAARPESLVITHEESFVVNDGSAEDAAELRTAEGVDSRGEVTAGIERVVAQEFEGRAVEFIRSGTEGEVYAGGATAEFSGEGVLLDFELLDGFDGRCEGRFTAGFGSGIDSIKVESDLVGSLSIDGDAVALGGCSEFRDARDQFCQFQEIAAIQRKFEDFAAADHLADLGIALFKDGRGGDDGYFGAGVAYVHSDGVCHRLADLDFEAGDFVGPEALHFRADTVNAGRHERKYVVAVVVSISRSFLASACIYQGHLGVRDNCLRGIGHLAGDTASVRLRGQRQAEGQAENNLCDRGKKGIGVMHGNAPGILPSVSRRRRLQHIVNGCSLVDRLREPCHLQDRGVEPVDVVAHSGLLQRISPVGDHMSRKFCAANWLQDQEPSPVLGNIVSRYTSELPCLRAVEEQGRW